MRWASAFIDCKVTSVLGEHQQTRRRRKRDTPTSASRVMASSRRDSHRYLVARAVTVLVVDTFELVEIEEQQRDQRLPLRFASCDCLFQPVGEGRGGSRDR